MIYIVSEYASQGEIFGKFGHYFNDRNNHEIKRQDMFILVAFYVLQYTLLCESGPYKPTRL